MSDFTLRVGKMPEETIYMEPDSKKGGNYALRDETLRSLLISHFEGVIKSEMERQGKEVFTDFNDIGQTQSNPWDIADVCFGKADTSDIRHYDRLTVLRNEYLKLGIKIKKSDSVGENEKLRKKQHEIDEKFTKIKEDYIIKQWENEQSELDNGEPEVKYAFVVFRHHYGSKYVQDAYSTPKWKRHIYMSFLGSCFCKREQTRLKSLHFFKKYLSISEAVEPDNIKWENLYSRASYRKCMTFVVWLVATGLIIASLLGIVIFKV